MSKIKNIFNHKINRKDEELIKFERVIYDDDNEKLRKLFNVKYDKSKGWKNDSYSGFSLYHGSSLGYASSKGPQYQRVVFKVHYGLGEASHNTYLKQYMPQLNKEEVIDKPVLFGTPDAVYDEFKVPGHFSFIISPENQNVNLEILTNDFIRRIENITGYKLVWKGAVHNDTNHHHAHLCINMKDENGRKVYFQKKYISKVFRELLSNSCTQLVGYRSQEEIQKARANLYLSKSFTELDKTILSFTNNDIVLKKLPQEIQNRIVFLADLELAEKVQDGVYTMKEGWNDTLMYAGRFNSYLTEYIQNHNTTFYKGGIISGVVDKVITFDKDESWRDALVIKTQEGQRVYVPVYNLIKEELLGKEVSISGGTKALSLQIKDSDIHIVKTKTSDKHNMNPETSDVHIIKPETNVTDIKTEKKDDIEI